MGINNGLYNMLFGENEHADDLLDFLNFNKAMFGRYRDCYLNHDGTKIIILTRCGGCNRDNYDEVFSMARSHNLYLTDYDDAIDDTYCYFEFKVPYEFEEQCKKFANGKEPLTVGERFEKEFEEMNTPGSEAEKRAQQIANYINEQIESQPDGGIIWMGDKDYFKEES